MLSMDAISEEEEKAEVAASRPLPHHVTITGRTVALCSCFYCLTTQPSLRPYVYHRG